VPDTQLFGDGQAPEFSGVVREDLYESDAPARSPRRGGPTRSYLFDFEHRTPKTIREAPGLDGAPLVIETWANNELPPHWS